ncbi:MAG: hypothetical protein ABI700_01945 [Chloroflexota bacterium]
MKALILPQLTLLDCTMEDAPDIPLSIACEFEPTEFITRFFGKSRLRGRSNFFGWGIIDLIDQGEGEFSIEGMFHLRTRMTPTRRVSILKRRLSGERMRKLLISGRSGLVVKLLLFTPKVAQATGKLP